MNAKAIVVDPKIVIEMSLREAQILRALVGGIDYAAVSEATRALKELFETLTNAGVTSERESYMDFFTGKVATRAPAKAAVAK